MKQSRRSWWALAVLGLGAAAMLVWLGQGGARGRPIRVAFAGPVSGVSADDGLAGVRAIEMIFDQVNEAGGVGGRPLVLDVYDDQNDCKVARANAPRIVDEANTVAVIGHNYSSCSLAAGEVYAERGIPAISSAATSVEVTRDNPWYFRTIFNDRAQGRFLALYLRQVLGVDRLGVIHETESYGAKLAQVVEETAVATGMRVATTWSFDPESGDLDARLDEIVRDALAPGGVDTLVLAVQPPAGVALVRRLRDGGYAGRIVASDTLASQAFFEGFRDLPKERAQRGYYTDGIYASTPFLFDAVGRRADGFLRSYLARYDESPDWYAAFAADAASVLVEALRRAEASPSPDTIEEDRRALRDALASIGPQDAVPGVTGPTFFDAVGDAEKPVSMGWFSNGEIVSAYGQLALLPGVHSLADVEDIYDPERIVVFEGQAFSRVEIARVGMLAERFDAVDFGSGTFGLRLQLWFRHPHGREVEDVVFTNAVAPIELGEPVDEVIDADGEYRRYEVEGVFRTDTIGVDYGQHALAISLHHADRTRADLVYAVDSVGMNLGRNRGHAERGSRARELLGTNGDWAVTDFVFFEAEVDENAMGHPSFLSGAAGVKPFSQLTVAAILSGRGLTLRRLIPQRYVAGVLVGALAGSFLLAVMSQLGSPRVRWCLQAALAALILLAGEPWLGNAAQRLQWQVPASTIMRVFQLAWWVVPAFFVNLAIDRFLWQQAEASSGRPIPTLLRWTVASVVYLLAVFGAVAFVYDYKLTGILATSGVVAMIVGLAVQLNITNLFAGVALNLERPFRVGDWIMIHGRTPDPEDGVIGKVIDINWRTTRLETADDTVIVVPNGVISEKTITNFMQPHEESRFELFFLVDQAVPPERVKQVMEAAIEELLANSEKPFVRDPRPKAQIRRVTENGIEYVVRYRLVPRELSPNAGRHLVNDAVVRHLHEAGIDLAVPRRVVQQSSGGSA